MLIKYNTFIDVNNNNNPFKNFNYNYSSFNNYYIL